MSSMAGAAGFGASGSDRGLLRQVAVSLVLAMLGLFVGLALVFALRRLGGALVEPLGGMALVILAVGLIALAAGLRSAAGVFGAGLWRSSTLWRSFTPYSVLSTQYLVLSTAIQILPGIAAFAILAALTLPGTSPLGIASAWFLLVAAEAATWLVHYRSRLPLATRPVPIRSALAPVTEEAADDSEEVSPDLVQQITRLRTESGGESLHALVRAIVPAGDRLAVVHLAFCPPLDAVPEISANAIDAEADVKLTEVRAYGVRLEVRAAETESADREILIELLGEAAPALPPAAAPV